ncbi:M28 family peptidase [Neorhizobium galegae]|uniref:M28 family peptidase n=1 Tax=Neorhizobium galegae TaxID=399 RepID=UPI0006225157|nr:M28 family peptidase [Neorhizobium galegae]MCQ1767454.1 M28 family peptidase [Neorhizobium galegae]MCQ1846395.1 M28 family peptidase [Neorhizobium galegae]CDZ28627.1 Double-zinc aminopeptidase [Neorhizobium galegae bv. officinalis]CDZ38312.1 Double-zinc aminopeptidase [Neorhizobium galegae bv. officinalis]
MSEAPLRPDRLILMDHIREFARRVKLSGTAEELESFRYLERQMASYGYRTQLLFHDAYISLPGKAAVEVGGAAIGCITHSMSVSTPAEGVSAEIVHVGEGTEADFEGIDVKGRIVLVDGIATEDVAAFASARGAIGQIHVSPNEHLYEMCVSPVWGSPSQHTREQLPKTAICTIARDDGEKLRQACRAGKAPVARLTTEVDTGWRKTPILVAELFPDNRPNAPFILFSGHHDTWHYGVMDNGGANATMLEAARLLAERRDEWRRGLRICFWSGHSHGRYSGSAWYADEYWDDLERRCVAHVNVDSTGGAGADILTNSAVIDELKAVAARAVETVTGQVHRGRRHGRAADQSFWGVGIPSMFGSLSHQPPGPVKMLTALGWWWHTPHDTQEHIDPANLQRDTEIVLRVLDELLAARVLPLDYAAYAVSLKSELDGLDADLAGRMDINVLISAVNELRRRAEAVNGVAQRETDPVLAEIINDRLRQASRLLVPLNYTFGDRFHHDSALPHPAWPSLSGLRELAALPEGHADIPFFAVHARQTRNRILSVLRQACAVLALEGS